jgi:hypothetical protein
VQKFNQIVSYILHLINSIIMNIYHQSIQYIYIYIHSKRESKSVRQISILIQQLIINIYKMLNLIKIDYKKVSLFQLFNSTR